MLRLYVKKINETFDIGEFTALPAVSQEYLIQYGIDQAGADSHASVVKKDWTKSASEFDDAVRAKVNSWIAKIQSGALRASAVEDPDVTTARTLSKLWKRTVTPDEVRAMSDPTIVVAPTELIPAKKHRAA
jgi:hypothetical protein